MKLSFFKEKLLIITIPFLLYYVIGHVAMNEQITVYEEGDQIIYGIIQTIPVIDGDSMSMRVKSNLNEVIQVHAFLREQKDQVKMKSLSPGDACKLNGNLSPPLPPTNFGQFNYQKYLEDQNVFWILRPEQGDIQCFQTSGNLYMKLQRLRHQQIHRIEQQVSPEFNGVMNALLFGERNFIEGDLIDAYQRLGVIHLLAVSGLHVGMIVTMLFYTFIRLAITRERAMEILLTILPVYVIIAGAAPSVIRASLMAMVVLICMRFKTRVSPLFGISFVYLSYLLIKPFALFHLGFQLSFLISFGLIISAPLIKDRYTHPFSQLLAVTLLSQVLSFPLLLYHMFEFSWLSIPLNIMYIPLITIVVLPLTLVAFFLSFLIPPTFNFPLLFLESIFPYIHKLLLTTSKMKYSSIVAGKPSIFLVFGYYIGVIYGCVMWERGRLNWWRGSIGIVCLLFICQISLPYLDARAKVTMIDVGQGDSILIELPFRRAIYLIDTGGTMSFLNEEWRKRRRPFEVGADVVIPTLKERGIQKIDRLILTHGHFDHIGGAMALLHSLRIDKIYYAEGPVEGKFEQELLTQFARNGTRIEFISEGLGWKEVGSTFLVLSPLGTETDLNERSIVLYGEVEGISFLFTGDLEEGGERRLLFSYPNLQIDVLKAGHHGSRTSTTEAFVTQINPKLVLISAGRRNRFGHPHPEVINRLEEMEITTLRTDLEGAIELTIKNRAIKVRKAMD